MSSQQSGDVSERVPFPQTTDVSQRRERYLTALFEVQKLLLAANRATEYDPSILKILGEASGASRVWVHEHEAISERVIVSRRAEWCASPLTCGLADRRWQHEDLAKTCAPWVPRLLQGEAIAAEISDVPQPLQQDLDALEVKAIAYIPIVAEGNFLGFLAFHNCVDARLWQPDELELMRSATTAIVLWHSRKRTEAELRTSRERYRTLVNNVPGIVYRCAHDANWTVEFVSETVQDIFGYPVSDFVNNRVRSLASLCHPDDVQEFNDIAEQAIVQGYPFVMDYRIIRADGEIRWVNEHGRAAYGPDQEVLWIDGIIFDITERKRLDQERQQAQESLRQRESQLRHQNEVLLELAQNKALSRGDLTAAIKTVTEAAAQTLKVERASVWLFNQTRTVLQCIDSYEVSTGEHAAGLRLCAADCPVYFSALESGRCIVAPDAVRDRRTRDLKDIYLRRIGITSLLDASIRVGGETVGVVCLEHAGNPRYWTPEDQHFVSALADSMAIALEALEHKRAETALQRSEAKFRTIFENSQVGIFRIRLEDGLILDANQRFIAMTGYDSPGQVIGVRRSQDFYLDTQNRKQALEILLRDKAINNFEARFRRSDGTILWGLLSGRLNEAEGYVEGVIADITKRKRAEEALHTSEQRFRTLVNNIPGVVYRSRFDSDWTVDFISDATMDIYGYPADEFRSNRRTANSLCHPDDLERVARDIRLAVATKRPYMLDYRIIHADGKIRWVYERGQAMYDDDGSVLWIDGLIFDITQRKKAEADLQESESLFRAIFQNAGIAINLNRTDGVHLNNNPASCEMLGYTVDEFRALSFTDISHPDDIELDLELYAELIGGKRDSYRLEKRFFHKDGHVVWVRLTVSAVRDASGQTQFTIGMAEDITEVKQTEEALRQAVAAAEVASRAKSQFLSNMSHELRTPLNVILGFSQLLARGETLTLQQRNYLDTISRSGEHLLSLINDVLEMSKIEAGKITLNDTNFDLYNLLDWLQQMLRLKAEAKGLQLVVQRDRNLPRYVCTDEHKLRQVLMNLLGNAIKFTQVGHVTLRAWDTPSEVSCQASPVAETTPRLLYFSVADTGIGIAAEELEHLFEPFVQTESGRQSQEGTGLGLSISRRFINLMGGEITVQSVQGQGSTFSVYVPICVLAPEAVASVGLHRRVIGLEPDQPLYRILVAEDKLSNRQLLVDLLTSVGFQVKEVMNGREAIALCHEWQPHLIWMDMRMPEMDGYEATRHIKATGASAPVIIALTGSAFEEDRRSAIANGCDDFVRKPIQVDLLFEKMAEHLGVRYVYAHETVSAVEVSSVRSETELLRSQQLIPTPEALLIMPQSWIADLHQAAVRVNAKHAHALIEQIPPEHHALADALHSLVNQFSFERIVALTHPHLV